MRVVVVSAWEPWRRTDGAAFVLDHQLRLLAARHEITLLAAGAQSTSAPPPETLAGQLPGVEIRWFGSSLPAPADYVGRRVWSVAHQEPVHVRFVERPALVSALQDAAPGADLVHLHGWGTARLWQHAAGTPTVHMAIDPWSLNAGNRRLATHRRIAELDQQRLVARHERRHYPKLGAVVVVTDRDATSVRELAPTARVDVIPNGVEAGPEPAPLRDRPVLGFHGVYDSQANVDAARQLVENILPLVRRTVPRAEVLLVGRRPPAEVKALAGQGVQLRSDVADVRAELSAMTVHVDWMTSGAGIKNKVLEAMAAARPVVASRLGSEGIGEGPGLLVAETIEAAADTITGLLRDLPAAAETGRAGRERVIADFSWATNADRIDSLWTELAR